MIGRGLYVAVGAPALMLACGVPHRPVEFSHGPSDLAALRKLSDDKVTMRRAAYVAPSKYYDGKLYFRIAAAACDRDPWGEVCQVDAARARAHLEAAVADVYRRDFKTLNMKTRQSVAALALQGRLAQLVPQQQQQQQPPLETPFKHGSLTRAARLAFGADAVHVDISSVSVTLRGLFRSGTSRFDPGHAASITKIAELANKYSEYELLIEGYTDSRGSAVGNVRVSRRRGAKIKAVLVQGRVPSARITVVGHGEAQPLEDNATAAGRAANRRIMVVFLK